MGVFRSMPNTAINKQSEVVNIIKVIGLVTMVIDHIGVFFLPEIQILRLVGRLSFPCFLYGVVNGLSFTKNVKKYALRLLLMGVLSIISWGTIFPFNIGFTLAFTVLGLDAFERKDKTGVLLYGLLTMVSEYSLYAYILGFIFYLFNTKRISKIKASGAAVLLHSVTAALLPTQIFGIFFLAIWLLANELVSRGFTFNRIPKTFGYLFYPVHILIFRLLAG